MKEEITTSSLQELINKRAEAKSRADIKILTDAISNSGLKNIRGFHVQEGETKRELCFALDRLEEHNTNNVLTQLYNIKLEKYIKSETKDFVSKVESLVEQTDNLLNIAENY